MPANTARRNDLTPLVTLALLLSGGLLTGCNRTPRQAPPAAPPAAVVKVAEPLLPPSAKMNAYMAVIDFSPWARFVDARKVRHDFDLGELGALRVALDAVRGSLDTHGKFVPAAVAEFPEKPKLRSLNHTGDKDTDEVLNKIDLDGRLQAYEFKYGVLNGEYGALVRKDPITAKQVAQFHQLITLVSGTRPRQASLDGPAQAAMLALDPAVQKYNALLDYYRTGEYKVDKLAKAAQLGADYLAAAQPFFAAIAELKSGHETTYRALHKQELADFERDGKLAFATLYHVNDEAEAIMTAIGLALNGKHAQAALEAPAYKQQMQQLEDHIKQLDGLAMEKRRLAAEHIDGRQLDTYLHDSGNFVVKAKLVAAAGDDAKAIEQAVQELNRANSTMVGTFNVLITY